MYDIIPNPREMILFGFVAGVVFALVAWGLWELAAYFIDVTISFA